MARQVKISLALCGFAVGAMPALAAAQIEPLVPVPALPTAPYVPVGPGEPDVRGRTVTDRPRPEVDPLGLRFGEMFLFPRLELDESYNDNIFATSGNTKSDLITTLAPSFDVISNYPQNAIHLSGGAAIGRYASHSSENFDDAFGAADGRFDMTQNNHLFGGLRFDRSHEPRTAPDAPGGAAEPVKYSSYTGNVGVSETGLRFGYEADASLRRLEYEGVPAVGGGIIPQSDRNENVFEGALRLSYEFVPDFATWVRGSGNYQDFDHASFTVPASPKRNSTGYRIDVGTRLDLTGVTYLEAYVGYLAQDYTARRFGSVSGFDIGGDLVWNVTTLDTVKLNAFRTVQTISTEVGVGTPGGTAAFINSPGYLQSVAQASIDHELLRNLLLNANAGYENDDFQGVSRTDNVYSLGAGAKYLLNRYLYLGASYTFLHRESSGTVATNPFTQNILMLRLSTQL